MLTLLVLVLVGAICILFSEEVSGVIKKWYGKYWVRTLVPLLVISWIWIWHDDVLPLLLAYVQDELILLGMTVAAGLPAYLKWFGYAVELFVLSSLPIWFFYWRCNHTGITERQIRLLRTGYAFTWLFFAILITMDI